MVPSLLVNLCTFTRIFLPVVSSTYLKCKCLPRGTLPVVSSVPERGCYDGVLYFCFYIYPYWSCSAIGSGTQVEVIASADETMLAALTPYEVP